MRVNFGVNPYALSFEKLPDGLQHATVECTILAFTNKESLVRGELSTVQATLKPDTSKKVVHDTFPCQQAIEIEPGN